MKKRNSNYSLFWSALFLLLLGLIAVFASRKIHEKDPTASDSFSEENPYQEMKIIINDYLFCGAGNPISNEFPSDTSTLWEFSEDGAELMILVSSDYAKSTLNKGDKILVMEYDHGVLSFSRLENGKYYKVISGITGNGKSFFIKEGEPNASIGETSLLFCKEYEKWKNTLSN